MEGVKGMVDTSAGTIQFQKVRQSRLPETDMSDLPFGRVYSDHMFMADFAGGDWKNLRIVPFGKIMVSPATPALHYGQSVFEGLKAHRGPRGEALVFRPYDNFRRLNISAQRMCLPQLPQEMFIESIRELISVDRDWIPSSEGSSLYIRPFLFSADEYIGIRPSLTFTYMVITSPVGAYYSKPVRVKIETHYTRAAEGGTGYAKAGGNYGGSIYPAKLAQDEGYDQLVWTDAKSHQYIEESGTMNIMFVIGDTLVTPALSDSILAGITRDSVLQLARSWGMAVEERRISVKELVDAMEQSRLQEAFGVGTAATIAHIESISFAGKDHVLPAVERRAVANKILRELDGLKRGLKPDPFSWVVEM